MTPTEITRAILRTVKALCQSFNASNDLQEPLSEIDLRKELAACILGSQVTHEMATKSIENLESCGMFSDKWWTAKNLPMFHAATELILSGAHPKALHSIKHRFYRSRAEQLAKARDKVAETPLSGRVFSTAHPKTIRKQLVRDIPGLGPKQASMFLRNSGRTYHLAILDSHVLRYLGIAGIILNPTAPPSTMSRYEQIEEHATEHAASLDTPVGYLDWAVWATMKAARELAL